MQNINETINEVLEVRSDDNILEIMRVKLRENVLTRRKENRASAWDKNRVLGDYRDEEFFSIKYVDEKVTLLKRRKISFKDYRRLSNALIQCEDNINAFLKVDQGLSSLVRNFSSKNPILQLYAANCCCNIALGNAKACTTLGKAIIPYLLTELQSLNYALLDVCIWTIGNLIAGTDKAFTILHAQHCLKYLILLLDNCNDSILPSVIYALLHYIHVGFREILETEMTEIVQTTIKRNLFNKDPNVAWLLALLSSSTICTAYLYLILPQVVDYLYQTVSIETTNISEITACIRILANTLYNSCEGETNVLLRSSKYSQDNLRNLFKKLLLYPHNHIQKETLWLIGNLYNHKSSSIRQDVKAILPIL